MKFSVEQNYIQRMDENSFLTTGNVGSVSCTFTFGEDYEGLSTFAVFYRDVDLNRMVELQNGQCVIPWEMLEESGLLYIGAYGVKMDGENLQKRMTTNFVTVRVVNSLSGEVSESAAPTPDLWELYRADVLSICEEAKQASAAAASIQETVKGYQDAAAASATSAAGAQSAASQSAAAAAQNAGLAELSKNQAEFIKNSTEVFYDVKSDRVGFRRANEDTFTYTDSLKGDKGEKGDPTDAYIKAETDGRYANAVLGEASGSAASLTDAWEGSAFQHCTVLGKTTETGTGDKSPDNPYVLTGASPTKVSVEETDYAIPTMESMYGLPNGACDSYDAVTGVETRKVGTAVFNPSFVSASGDDSYAVMGSNQIMGQAGSSSCICDKLKRYEWNYNNESMEVNTNGQMFARILKSRLTGWEESMTTAEKLQLMKNWANENPLTVLYERKTPVKTQHEPTVIRPSASECTVVADAGDISVTYTKDTNKMFLALKNRITALENNN